MPDATPTNEEITKLMEVAGVLPPRFQRVVIDIDGDESIEVNYECFAAQGMIEALQNPALATAMFSLFNVCPPRP